MAKRWLATDFGGLEVLRQVSAALPSPGPGEVAIQVRAADINPADYKHFALARAGRSSRRRSATRYLGCDRRRHARAGSAVRVTALGPADRSRHCGRE